MWICVKCKEFHEDTFDSCWKCQTFNAKSQSKKRERPKQVKEWTDAVSYTDLKKNVQTIIREGKISGAISGTIRKVIVKTIVRTLEKPKGIGKIFNFAGDKATRKGGPTANKMLGLKGLQKPIINYAKKGRLTSSEESILRDELRKNAGALSWGAGAIVILILSIPAGHMLTMWFLPIVGELIRLVYKKWGVEWFLQGWNSREKNNQQLKQ